MSEAPETPYRSAVNIEALASRLDELEKKVARLERHHHGTVEVVCPGCGTEHHDVVTEPWSGVSCFEKLKDGGRCLADLVKAIEAKGEK